MATTNFNVPSLIAAPLASTEFRRPPGRPNIFLANAADMAQHSLTQTKRHRQSDGEHTNTNTNTNANIHIFRDITHTLSQQHA